MLSGGQKQRIAIAGAVAMRPECIVFDEPTAMLDPKGRRQVMEIIRDLNESGITTILITHFMEEAEQADRIIVMYEGTVLSDGSPAEIFANTRLIKKAGLELPVEQQLLGRTLMHLNERNAQSGRFVSCRKEKKGQSSLSESELKSLAVDTRNLRYVYSPGMPGETVALDCINLRINSGEICGIVGHTGSGKSTLLQHLNGLIKPSEGEIYVNGSCITDGSTKMVDIRKKVGLVFQYPEYQLFEETVAKDVAFGPKNLGISGDELDKRVRDAIELVGLDYEKIAEASPFELSGGMKRRVAIAGVIAMDPDVLILDEPTAGLDPRAHREILEMVRRIRERRDITIIFVSHNMGDIAEMSDNVIVLNRGRIALQGTPHEVFEQEKELESIGLGLPPVTVLVRKKYPDIKTTVLTLDEAIEEIEKLKLAE